MSKLKFRVMGIFAMIFMTLTPAVAYAAVRNSRITVDESFVIKTSDSRQVGINDDLWMPYRKDAGDNSTLMNPQYYETLAANQYDIPFVRSFIDDYEWKGIVGDADDRSYETRGSGKRVTMGLIEYIQSCREVTSDVKFDFVVNIYDSVENLNDLVRFLTLEPEHPNATGADGVNYAQMRVDLGVVKPVDAMFELGNELDMQFYESNTVSAGAAWYIDRCLPIIAGIRSVNPDVQIAVFSYTIPHDGTNRTALWNAPVISQLGEHVDYIAHHFYYHVDHDFYDVWKTRFGEEIIDVINQLSTPNKPKVFISEFSRYVNPTASTEEKKYTTNLKGVLATAEFINRMENDARFGPSIYHALMGNYSTEQDWGGHGWGVLRPYYNGGLYVSGVGELFGLLDKARGIETVRATADGNVYCNETYYFGKHTGYYPLLTVNAQKRADGGLNLILVNRSESDSHQISFSANNSYALEKEVVLTADSILSDNTPSAPEGLYWKTILHNQTGAFSSYTMEPKCVVVLYLAPSGTTFYNSMLDVKINGRDIIREGGAVASADGRISMDAAAYSNESLADAASLCVTVKDSNNQIVYIMQKDMLKKRVNFDFTMPKDAEEGIYTVMLGNTADSGSNRQYVDFTYLPAVGSEKIASVSLLNCDGFENGVPVIANSDYFVDLHISFNEDFHRSKVFNVEAVKDGDRFYYGQGERVDGTENHGFYLPKDAPSGRYSVRVFGDDAKAFAAKDFQFVKPSNRIDILSKPTDQDGYAATVSKLADTESISLQIGNKTGERLIAFSFLVLYDAQDNLISTAIAKTPLEGMQSGSLIYELSRKDNAAYMKIYIWSVDNSPHTEAYIIKI